MSMESVRIYLLLFGTILKIFVSLFTQDISRLIVLNKYLMLFST